MQKGSEVQKKVAIKNAEMKEIWKQNKIKEKKY